MDKLIYFSSPPNYPPNCKAKNFEKRGEKLDGVENGVGRTPPL
ncbi:hypothetical protein BGS_0155 [Beggiatoa sp. SS]|nr:hypothetical protein BGS_0155 [Beggiatoa sp. SS]